PMNRLTDREIDEIARRIAADIQRGGGSGGPAAAMPAAASGGYAPDPSLGIFGTVSEAVRAAGAAQVQFAALPLATRARILAAMRQSMLENGDMLAKAAHDETGYGRYEDIFVKDRPATEKTPG